jgi:hypothetical protein
MQNNTLLNKKYFDKIKNDILYHKKHIEYKYNNYVYNDISNDNDYYNIIIKMFIYTLYEVIKNSSIPNKEEIMNQYTSFNYNILKILKNNISIYDKPINYYVINSIMNRVFGGINTSNIISLFNHTTNIPIESYLYEILNNKYHYMRYIEILKPYKKREPTIKILN